MYVSRDFRRALVGAQQIQGMEQWLGAGVGPDEAATAMVLQEVAAERAVQRGRWTNRHDDDNTLYQWMTYLTAYLGYVAQAVFSLREKHTEEAQIRYEPVPLSQLRTALIKVAATAVAWAEAIDRKISQHR